MDIFLSLFMYISTSFMLCFALTVKIKGVVFLKILFVCDQFEEANNGTTISARRFAQALADRGNELRVLSCGKGDDVNYGVRELRLLPLANKLVKSQGMEFAMPNRRALKEALEWCDVVHFYMPFALSIQGMKMAEKMDVPRTAAFHVQPENITFSIGMGNAPLVNDSIYHLFRNTFFNHFSHIHCPSNFIANELKKHGYTAQLHVISNGISPSFCYRKAPKPRMYEGKYVITMIGRLSGEKRQDLLIDAVRLSKHAKDIQLVFAGQGPQKDSLKKYSADLAYPPVMKFFSEDELHELLSYTDLYVHTSDVEIEAISCIEAFASGLVPVISNSPRSATGQFALDERSLFTAGDPQSLADKIDYWLEHPEEKAESERLYAQAGLEYHLDASAAKAEEMFLQAINENKACQ